MDKLEVIKQGLMQMISAGASKTDLVRAFGTLTMDMVLDNRFPSLASLHRSAGLEKTEKALAVVLLEASSAFEGSFDKDSALELAAEIKATYYFLSLEDCYVCMQELKKEKVYGKLTANKVLTAIKEYTDKRLELAGQRSLNNHLANKPSPGERQSEQKAFKEFVKQYKIDKLKQKYPPQK